MCPRFDSGILWGPCSGTNLRRIFLLAASAASIAPALSAQVPPTEVLDILKLPRTERIVITAPVRTDHARRPARRPGWADLPPLCMVMQTPTFGEACSERSEALLGYDDDYVYVAGRMYDREPDKIQSPTKKRDAMVATTDWFGVFLDTFNDKENSLAFFTTPAGLRFDAAIFRDAQFQHGQRHAHEPELEHVLGRGRGPRRRRLVRRDAHPALEPPLPGPGGDVVMGVTVFRWLARRNETDVFPAIPLNWGEMSAWKPSQARRRSGPGSSRAGRSTSRPTS